MSFEWILLIVLLALSGFFSASEIAFLRGNKIKIELWARNNNLLALNAKYFLKNPDIFFSTILISNNLVNISFASLCSIILIKNFGFEEISILIISTVLLLLFGELIPKYFASELADRLLLASSIPLRFVSIMLFPFVKIAAGLSIIISRTSQKEQSEILNLIDKEDLQNLIDESSEAGTMDEDQSEIISRVIEIKEQRVYEAMTPRTDVVGIEISNTMDEVTKVLIESGYSKLPVYEENLDNIKGWIYSKDIFKNPKDLASIIREASFVPETKKSLEMLNEFLEKQFFLAIVVDEFGGTAGIITMEDLIEELFGEIRDEYDVADESFVKRIDKKTFVISGKIEIDYLNDEHEFSIPEGDYSTIAGYITYKIGRIPIKGETLKIDNLTVLILKSDKTKINLCKVIREQEME
jgi:CBS domain containing-hemolysin-like protein